MNTIGTAPERSPEEMLSALPPGSNGVSPGSPTNPGRMNQIQTASDVSSTYSAAALPKSELPKSFIGKILHFLYSLFGGGNISSTNSMLDKSSIPPIQGKVHPQRSNPPQPQKTYFQHPGGVQILQQGGVTVINLPSKNPQVSSPSAYPQNYYPPSYQQNYHPSAYPQNYYPPSYQQNYHPSAYPQNYAYPPAYYSPGGQQPYSKPHYFAPPSHQYSQPSDLNAFIPPSLPLNMPNSTHPDDSSPKRPQGQPGSTSPKRGKPD
ncbi:MAG: hypothetical protein LBI69_00770 [Puniceicoccales bacterium]|nr:hypothetical protein [Puniceicoccales bacterium]